LRTPDTRAALAKPDDPIATPFPNDTPLGDVLKYITQATTNATTLGVPIVVDAFGLQEAGKPLRSTVKIDLEGGRSGRPSGCSSGSSAWSTQSKTAWW
jgi:hypothetical protein